MYDKNTNRVVIERELIALIFSKNEIIDLLQIKPSYLFDESTRKILECMIRCYQEHKTIEITTMCQYGKGFPIDEYIDIITNDMYYTNSWERQLSLSQELILNHYKEDVIKNINTKLENGEITYIQFQEKMEKIGKVNILSTNNNRMKTMKDINFTYEEKTFIKSGTKDLDNSIKGFILGELSVWSGGNASGKSSYLNQVALQSIQQGYKVAIFSGELTDKRLLNWIILNASGKNYLNYDSEKGYYFPKKIVKDKILKWLNGNLFVYDNSYGNDAKEIIESVKACVKKNDIKVIILDNLMSMNLAKYGEQKYDVQTKLITDLSNLAKELNVHIHFVCHPRKSTAFLRKIDISGSSDLTNIADNVFIVHRVNDDFKKLTKENFKWKDDNDIYNFDNVIEICKNREFGVQDTFARMYFEKESKRMLNCKGEELNYGWKYLD